MNEMIKSFKDMDVIKGDKENFATFNLESDENKIKLYNSLQQCDILLNDIKNETIEIEDIFIERKKIIERNENGEIVIDENGEVKEKTKYRVILYGTNGKTYVTSSYGVYNSITTIIEIFNVPSHEKPYKLKVVERPMKNTNHKSLALVYLG